MQNPSTPNLPLRGVRVMVARPEQSSDPLAELLRDRGAEVILQPAIRILPPPDWQPVDDALARLHDYDWLVFSSANGVDWFFNRRRQTFSGGPDEFPTKWPRAAAMGPGTADALARHGILDILTPVRFDADALADALCPAAAGRKFLLIRASRGRETLAERLATAGATVKQVVAYTNADVEQPNADVEAMLRAGQIDWIAVTSSAIARSLVKMFGDDLRLSRLAAMSPITGDTLRRLGYAPTVEAAEATFAALAAAIAGQ